MLLKILILLNILVHNKCLQIIPKYTEGIAKIENIKKRHIKDLTKRKYSEIPIPNSYNDDYYVVVQRK
jgi:hypothetical protein